MTETYPSIGMISGNGVYPETFARAARKAGVERLVAAAFHNETESSLEEEVDELSWFRVGQLGKVINYFKKQNVRHAVMVGQIAPSNLFDIIPDTRTAMLLLKLKTKNAESIFGAIADELAKDGIELLLATTYLDDLIPEAGHVCGPKLKGDQIHDADWGFGIAKEVSRMDIGQTIVVKNGTVLAVEAFEGTNRAIERGGKLGKGKAMVVKVSKPNQDLRFDVPCVGPATIETARDAQVSAIVVEAGKTLLLDREKVIELCAKSGVTIFAKTEDPKEESG
ncbi:MAG: UDP-2,3-diacylglucosamine diphosphatase LpxI [Verrucomicrobiota bacterium]